MPRLPVTLCVSTRNAGAELGACIESVADWVSEIVVVDMESSDDTLAVASDRGARIVSVPAAGWAEPGRQAGLDAATQPWVLVLDADERAGPGIEAIAARCVAQSEIAGVWLARQNFQFGWWVPTSGIWPDRQLRLFDRARASWPAVWTHAGPKVEGPCENAVATLENAIVHHSFASISAWVGALDRYTSHEADRLAAAGHRPTLRNLFGVPVLRFGDLYVRRGGLRGGRYGLTVALLSFCYWVLAELKLWERSLGSESLPSDSVASVEATKSPNASSPDAL